MWIVMATNFDPKGHKVDWTEIDAFGSRHMFFSVQHVDNICEHFLL
jgi:hypothetical protein